MNYSYPTTIFKSIFAQMYKFLIEKYIFTIFAYELSRSKWKIVNNTRNTLYLDQSNSKYCSQFMFMQMVFS